MEAQPRTYQIEVDQFLVERNDLGLMGRLAATVTGQWPKVMLHKIECPCCGKVTFHRPVRRQNGRRDKRRGHSRG